MVYKTSTSFHLLFVQLFFVPTFTPFGHTLISPCVISHNVPWLHTRVNILATEPYFSLKDVWLKSYFFLDFRGVFGETVRDVHLI